MLECNSAKVAHRDIKEENIIIDWDTLEIRIVDFGLGAIILNNMEYPSMTDGSEMYLPPEYLKYDQYNHITAEPWACGTLLHNLVVGKPPFDNVQDQVRCRLTERPPNAVSPELYVFIMKTLSFLPRHRPNLVKMLSDPWLIKMLPPYMVGASVVEVNLEVMTCSLATLVQPLELRQPVALASREHAGDSAELIDVAFD